MVSESSQNEKTPLRKVDPETLEALEKLKSNWEKCLRNQNNVIKRLYGILERVGSTVWAENLTDAEKIKLLKQISNLTRK